jgi:hypothetical protein
MRTVKADPEATAKVLAEIRRLESLLEVHSGVRPGEDNYCRHGTPFVRVDESGYHLFSEDRGVLTLESSERSLEEFLFSLFFKASPRVHVPGVEHSDYRRRAYPKQLERLARVSPAWAERAARAQRKDLAEHPFDDEQYFRIARYNKLVAQGASEAEANRLADEEYPRPQPALQSAEMIANLKESIEPLRAEMRRIETSHPEDRERLARLVVDLERASHTENDHAGLTSQVREAVTHFEAEHPEVTAILSRVLSSLGSVGM